MPTCLQVGASTIFHSAPARTWPKRSERTISDRTRKQTDFGVCTTHLLTYSLTHSLTHLLTHSLTHLLTNSLLHLLTHLLTYPLTHSLSHSLTYSLTGSTSRVSAHLCNCFSNLFLLLPCQPPGSPLCVYQVDKDVRARSALAHQSPHTARHTLKRRNTQLQQLHAVHMTTQAPQRLT